MLWELPEPPLDDNDGSDQSEESMLVPLLDRQDPLDHLAFAHDNPTWQPSCCVLELFILALSLCLDQLFDYVFWRLFICLAGVSALRRLQVVVGPLIICWALQAARKPYICALIAWRYDNPIGLKAQVKVLQVIIIVRRRFLRHVPLHTLSELARIHSLWLPIHEVIVLQSLLQALGHWVLSLLSV